MLLSIKERIHLPSCKVSNDNSDVNGSINVVGIDIRTKDGKIAYKDGDSVYILGCNCPWNNWTLDSLKDIIAFELFLKDLASTFVDSKIGIIKRAVFVVPYSFTHLQKYMINIIASQEGMHTYMDGAGVFSSMAQYFYERETDRTCLEVITECRDDFWEMSVMETGDGVYESLGQIGLKNNCKTETEFHQRIVNEATQYLKEIHLYEKPKSGDAELCVYSLSDRIELHSAILPQWMSDGRIQKGGEPVLGSLLQGLMHIGLISDSILLSTINRSLWVGLGENGEHGIVIPRYTTIPCKSSKKLLLSTELELKIYEGNYENPNFDTLLTKFSIDPCTVKEGTEIECEIDIDANWGIYIRISDCNGKPLINSIYT